MQKIAEHRDLTKNTLKRIKSLASAVFTHAKRIGVLNGVNPMQGVSIPKARGENDTYAYSLEEIVRMLEIVPEPARTVMAVAGLAGLRLGEIRGLCWEDYDGVTLRVSRSIWETHVTEPKTRKSKAPVPVIEPLRRMLDNMKPTTAHGSIFTSSTGGAMWLDNLAYRVIRPALESEGIKWHGYHGFRRGLATNLYRLGVPAKVIQRILRHSSIAVTQHSYIKDVPADAAAAMKQLERQLLRSCATDVRQVN